MPVGPLDSMKAARTLVVVGTDPPANTEISETVPAGKVWQLISVTVPIVQGLTQTPRTALSLDDGVDEFFGVYGSTVTLAVSSTAKYTWIVGTSGAGSLGGVTPNLRAIAALPDGVLMKAGYRIRTITDGIGANTNYGAPVLYVVEYDL